MRPASQTPPSRRGPAWRGNKRGGEPCFCVAGARVDRARRAPGPAPRQTTARRSTTAGTRGAQRQPRRYRATARAGRQTQCSEPRKSDAPRNGPRENDGAGAASEERAEVGEAARARGGPRAAPRLRTDRPPRRLLASRYSARSCSALPLSVSSAIQRGCRWRLYAQRCRCRGPLRPGGAAAAPAGAHAPWLRRTRHPARSCAPPRRTSTGRRWSVSRGLRVATCLPPVLRCLPSRHRSHAPTAMRSCRCAPRRCGACRHHAQPACWRGCAAPLCRTDR